MHGGLDRHGVCSGGFVIEHVSEVLGMPQDRGEHVGEVVGDAGSEPADGIRRLRLTNLLLEPFVRSLR